MPKVRDVFARALEERRAVLDYDRRVLRHEPTYRRYRDDPALGAQTVAALYGVDAALVKRFAVDRLNVVKLSYPRPQPQGGVVERDMHAGQQFATLLDVELS